MSGVDTTVQSLLGDQGGTLDQELDEDITRIIQQAGPITQPKQALEFFTSKAWAKVGGQQLTGNCIFCHKSVTSSGAQRLVEHIATKCHRAPKAIKSGFRDVQATKEKKRADKRNLEAVIMEERAVVARSQLEAARAKVALQQTSMKTSLQVAQTNVADQAIAQFFYANGLPFSCASTEADSYYKEMIAAIKNTPPSYSPPNASKISVAHCWMSAIQTCGLVDQDQATRSSRPAEAQVRVHLRV